MVGRGTEHSGLSSVSTRERIDNHFIIFLLSLCTCNSVYFLVETSRCIFDTKHLNLECNNAQQEELKKQEEDAEEVSFSWLKPRLGSI